MRPPPPPPLIAVTGRAVPADRIVGSSKDSYITPQAYTHAVICSGGHVAVVPPVLDATRAAAATWFDGLLLTGGGDVDPALFGEAPHPAVYGVDRSLDEFEIALALAAIERGVPVLAVCRGMQVLNVALGGTLDQHITGREGLGVHGDPVRGGGNGVLHDVAVAAGSRTAAALGTERAVVHSHHHQAVGVVADGCTVTAWADDGLVEGFEVDAHPWCVAVQWHPEMTFRDDPAQLALFRAFVSASATAAH